MLNSSIVNFFTILLQCNSKHRMNYTIASIVKKKNNILFDSLFSVSHLCLSLTEPKNHITAKQPTPYHTNLKTETATCSPAPKSIANPAPYHAIKHGDTISRIRDPRITIIEHGKTHIMNSRSTTHDPQPEQCEYELIMERMKFWVLLKSSSEI